VSILGDAKSSMDDAESSLGDAKSSLGDVQSSLGDTKSSLGDAESSLGDAKSSMGDAKSSLGDVQEATPLAAAVDRPAVPEQWAAVVPASGEEEQQQLEKALHMSRVQSEGRLNGLTVVSRVASGAVLMDVGERADSTTVVEGAHEEGDEELQAGRWVGWI
jgi:hypothetical protein